MTERLTADYLLRTARDPAKVAATVAGEQSSGTFVPTPGESPELKERSLARVEVLEEVADSGAPALPGSTGGVPKSYQMRLSWPMANLGPSLPNVMATVAGNLFELKDVAGLRLLDIGFPDEFAAAYPGPAFGVEGTRELSGVERGPLIGTIIKPSVGMTPGATAELCDELCAGGIDFIKDDELQADGPHCPFAERFAAVMEVIDRHAQRTGRKVMYAVNLTGDLDEMRARHDLVAERGGTCVMLSLNSVGLVGVAAFRKHAALPIHAHRNGWGYLGRSPDNGFSYVAWQKIWRLAGVDHMHVNGLANKFFEDDASVIASARECLTPMFAGKPCIAMPVFSSGQTVHQAGPTYAALGSADLIHTAGGGIVAHPGGVADGVRAFRDAWEAAMARVPAAEAAKTSPALAAALEAYA